MEETMQAKWIEAFLNLLKHDESRCPYCNGKNLDYGYVLLDDNARIGYGAVWCKDCNHAFSLSRAKVKSSERVLPELPSGLIFA